MKKWSLIAMNQSKKDIIPSQKKIRRKIMMIGSKCPKYKKSMPSKMKKKTHKMMTSKN